MSSSAESSPARRLRLYAVRAGDGEVRDTYLVNRDGQLAIWQAQGSGDEQALALPPGALGAVFRRYGKPLADGLTVAPLLVDGDEDDVALAVAQPEGDSALLRRFRFLPYGWVHPADYLLWQPPGGEALAAPAPLIASALAALGRAAAR